MKKKNAVVLAGMLAAGLACAPVQAKTFAVDLDGKTYYVTVEDGQSSLFSVAEDVAETETAPESVAETEAAPESVTETEITLDDLDVSDVAEAEEAGITVQTQSEVTVVLPDGEDFASIWYAKEPDGEGTLTYRYLEEPGDEAEVTYRYVAVEDEPEDYYVTIRDEDGNIVAELPGEEALVSYLQKEDDSVQEQAYSIVFTGDFQEDEQARAEEYEKAGITQDDSGAWMFRGRQVNWLVDEDGGIYMNNSEKDKKKRYCVVVKRDEDGSIEDVVEVSLEDAVRSALASE